MIIVVNGKSRSVGEGISVAQLLERLGIHPLRAAVLLNQDVVKRGQYEATFLKEGDRLEIVTIMAGGAEEQRL